MSSDDNEIGPKFVWTFPVVTRMQERRGFLEIGNNVGLLASKIVSNSSSSSSDDGSDSSSEYNQDGSYELEEEVDEVKEEGEELFGYSEESDNSDLFSDENEVGVHEGVFTPTAIRIDPGDSVTWTNEDDRTHKIMSVEGPTQFSSDQLEPGDSFTQSFDQEGVYVYVDNIVGGDVMSGAVLVGDVERPDTLPSEGDSPTPVPFEGSGTKSMSEAAEAKQQMESGF